MREEEKREMICISCPTGCRLSVSKDADGEVKVEGNACIRGVKYGVSEYTRPTRVITTLVRVKGGERSVVSCRTDAPVPKEEIFVVLEFCKHIVVTAPINQYDLIAENVSPGVNLVATADCALKHK